MKLALLIALSADKRSGQPLTPDLVPFDQALKDYKAMVESGVGAAPVVELWSGGRVVKSARFRHVKASALEVAVVAPEVVAVAPEAPELPEAPQDAPEAAEAVAESTEAAEVTETPEPAKASKKASK